MSLRKVIKRSQIIKQNLGMPLVLMGEPMLYSVKYALGERRKPIQYFRDKKFQSLLKCWFPTYLKKTQPVVIIVCFYVSPFHDKANISSKHLKAEKTPACWSWELSDILLSFLEMLRGVLFAFYKQIVKIDCMKFYSDNPRTTFQYLSWANYVNLQNNHTLDTKAETVGRVRSHKKNAIQPKRKRNGKAIKLRERFDFSRAAGVDWPSYDWAITSDHPFSFPIAEGFETIPTPEPTPDTTY